MEDKYKKLFKNIEIIEVPKGLEARITTWIDKKEKRLARIRIFAFGGSAVASFGASFWAMVYLIKSVEETGFWQYFSIIFSENGAALAYWKELSISLAESLPITSCVMFFAAIGFFVWSFAKVLTNMPKNVSASLLTN